jgi:Flp pilus assembly protein TadD
VTQRSGLSVPEVVMSGFALVGQYGAKLFWPHPLLGYYVFQESKRLDDPRVLGGLAALLLCTLLFVFLWRRARPYSFALVWMAVTILPVLNVRWMAASAFAERYLYLPSVGFCALVAGGGVWLWKQAGELPKARWALGSAAVALAALATVAIVARNPDWRDDKSFFIATLAVDPHASYMRTSLAVIEWSEYQQKDAVRNWQAALADKPDNAIALSNLGMAMIEEKRWDEAEAYLQKAIQLRPRFAGPHGHLGRMYIALDRPADAEREFRRAVEISPLNAEARNQLAKFYAQQGRIREAEEQFRTSLDSSMTAEALSGLGDVLAGKGASDEAMACWKKAVELSPYDPHLHLALGGAYQSRGSAIEAEKQYRAVLLMEPQNEQALEAMHELRPAEFPTR